jgi:large conductance mechanosensitive channel
MGFLKEFREFALKGNVVELAVAVIIGAAFGLIIASLVGDVITPLLLTPALEAAGAENLDQLTWGTVRYGRFLVAVINFFLVAVVLFLLVKGINRLKREKAEVPKTPELTLSEKTLLEIRDALKR